MSVRSAGIALLLVVAAASAACSDDPAASEVAFVQIDPDAVELEVGQALMLAATAFDEAGKKMDAGEASWSSSDPAIAAVDESGEALGVGEGDAIVTATVAGVSGRTNVKVIPAVVTRVEIAPASPSVRPDETVQLTATAFTAWESPPTGRAVSWVSADPDLASVSESGLVRGREPGLATILATVEGVPGSVVVEVIANVGVVRVEPTELVLFEGESSPLAAVIIGTNGVALSDREVEWSSSVADIATVDESGMVRALRPGKATIYAEVEGVQNLATVEVKALPATLRIEPPSLLLQVDTTWGLAAIITDTLGAEHAGEGCTWRSLDPEVLLVGDDGAVHALALGTTHVEARCEGKQASIEVEVIARAELVIQGPDKVVVGESIQLEASMEGRAPGSGVEWSVRWEDFVHGAVAEVDDDGTLHGLLPGRPWVFARSEGRAAGREILSVLRFTELRGGPYHTCGLATVGEFFCWGNTRLHLFGQVAAWPTPFPHRVFPPGRTIDDIALGEIRSYGIEGGDLIAWGCPRKDEHLNQCALEMKGSELEPADGSFTRVSAGYAISEPGSIWKVTAIFCGLDAEGRVLCWGITGHDAQGYAMTDQRFVDVGSGVASVCALTAEGEAWCWGTGGIFAADGITFVEGSGSPVPAPLAGAPAFASLSIGKYHACGVTPAGAAWCWGHSREGALGAGFPGSSEAPVEVAGGHIFRHVSASIEHTCGLTVDDELYCWGKGEPEPVAVGLAGPFIQVVAGADHACALHTDGVAICWGDASLYQTADDLRALHDGSPRPVFPENREIP